MRRRMLLVAFSAFAACSDPYASQIPDPDPPARDAGTDAGGDERPGPIDAGTDDAAVDAGTDAADDARADADACDRDHDGFLEKGACGGTDCDDDDLRAHPDAGAFVAETPTLKTAGDWNCDAVVEKQFAVNVSCSALGPSACTAQGFKGDPGCGQVGEFVVCKLINVGLTCGEQTPVLRKQACR